MITLTLFMEIMLGGKTNIIESIFLCSMGKSFRARKDTDLIQFEKDKCSVQVFFEKVDRSGNITCKIDKQKVFLINRSKTKQN